MVGSGKEQPLRGTQREGNPLSQESTQKEWEEHSIFSEQGFYIEEKEEEITQNSEAVFPSSS